MYWWTFCASSKSGKGETLYISSGMAVERSECGGGGKKRRGNYGNERDIEPLQERFTSCTYTAQR